VVEVLRTPLPTQLAEQHSELPPLGVTRHSRIPQRGRHLGLVALVCVALGGAWLVSRAGPGAVPAAAPQREARLVSLEVDASPPSAEIFLDGRRIGKGYFRVSEVAEPRVALLEVRAPGYVTAHRELSLDRNSSIDVVLKAESPPTSATTESPKGARTPAKAAGPAPGAIKPRVSRAAAKAPAQKATKRAANCNPPYTLGADGVKTYKTECF
jgi:hypothetical protein